jgi:RHS repeat-associated protein
MPINIATGDVEIARDDFVLPGRVPIKWTRRYRSSLLSTNNSPLGTGWTTSWFPTLRRAERTWQFVSSQGDQNLFLDPEGRVERGQVVRHLGAFLELVRDGDRYVVTQWDVESGAIVRFVFAADGPVDTPSLMAVENISGDGVDVTYEAPSRLKSLRQRIEKRTVLVNYLANGLIGSLILTGKEGARSELVRYEYDLLGRLSVVFDRRGLANRYEYDAKSRLTREILKDGAVYHYRYDDRGRCVHFSGLDRYNEKRLRYMDSAGRTMVTNSYGKTSIFESLPSGQIAGEVDPSGCQRKIEFDEFNRIVAKIDPNGSTTSYTYDESGNRDSITNPLGQTYRFNFNAYHQPVSVTNPLGKTWHCEYDVKHRLAATRNPMGARRVISYDQAGNPSVITDPLGSIRRLRSEDGLLREMTDLMGHTIRFKWDDFGRVIERIGAVGERTTIRYDPVGNPIEVGLPDGGRLSATYDGGDNLGTFTNAKGHTTCFRYGSCRRLLERIDPLGRVVRYRWGTEPNRLEEIINEKGESLTYSRDDQGQVVRERSFDGREHRFEYDPAGWCNAVINGNGETVRVKRDGAGRVSEQLLPDGALTTYEYDNVGRILAAENPDIAIRFEYDDAGRLVRELQGEHWVETAYNAAGAIVRTTTSLGHEVRYDLDPNGRLQKLSTASDQSISFERDARGLETVRHMPGAMRLEQRHDSMGRLVNQRVGPRFYRTELSVNESHILAGHEVIERGYGYDANGLLLSIADDRWGVVNYAHGPAERLLNALREGPLNEHFEYDVTDNLSRVSEYVAQSDKTCRYGPGNRLLARGDTRFEYDPEGRLVKKTEEAVENKSRVYVYLWDAFGQLRKIRRPDGEEWEYKYDAFGRRFLKKCASKGRRFLWSGDSIIQELPEQGPVVAWIMKPRSFVPLAKVQQGLLFPIITDHLGTPREMFDSSGKLVWAASLSAWGRIQRIHTAPSGDDCPIRFQGQWFDEESGLHYNRFRFYDPALGRFLTPDPIGVAGGKNLYQYVANPVGGVDPLGLTEPGCIDSKTNDQSDQEVVQETPPVKLMYHYTTADESEFAGGLWRDSSVTDKLYTDPIQAGQELGIPTPDKVIPIVDNGQFVPNKPPIVQPSNRYQGGGTDFVNPKPVPPSDILPAIPM